MNHSPLFLCICTVFLVAALFAAGCTVNSGGNVTPMPVPTPAQTTPPPGTPGLSTCGFMRCHGLDLACGMDAPQVCTLLYQLGDTCRQYARCDTRGGSCALLKDAKFDACKSCVEQCVANAGSGGYGAFDCEAKC